MLSDRITEEELAEFRKMQAKIDEVPWELFGLPPMRKLMPKLLNRVEQLEAAVGMYEREATQADGDVEMLVKQRDELARAVVKIDACMDRRTTAMIAEEWDWWENRVGKAHKNPGRLTMGHPEELRKVGEAIAYAKCWLDREFDRKLKVTSNREIHMARTIVIFTGFGSEDPDSLGMSFRADIDDRDLLTANDSKALGRWLICQVMFSVRGDPVPVGVRETWDRKVEEHRKSTLAEGIHGKSD